MKESCFMKFLSIAVACLASGCQQAPKAYYSEAELAVPTADDVPEMRN